MSDNKVTKSMRIDEKLANDIEKISKSENRSFSNMVTRILQEYVEKWEKNEKKDEQ